MNIKLGTKAETLLRLKGKLKYSNVLPQFYFTVRDWKENKNHIYDSIEKLGWFSNSSVLIVRSSAVDEDKVMQTMAGHYKSILNVKGEESFDLAVQQVIASFGMVNEKNQILVQPMLRDVQMSGVVFTLDPSTAGCYYVINYDDVSGMTDTITSGRCIQGKLLYCFKDYTDLLPSQMSKICKACNEVEKILKKDNLDVEFAISNDGIIYILQVRELYVRDGTFEIETQKKILFNMEKMVGSFTQNNPFLYGNTILYGQMPDWNITEVLGVYPKPLALSIFREIAADTTWARQRYLLGYRNVQGFPLVTQFGVTPYVNVLVSFNSLLPDAIDKKLGDKLIDYYINKLKTNRNLHDKVEFEVLFTCYTFDIETRMKELLEFNFDNQEINLIIKALKDLTVGMVLDKKKKIENCYNMLENLEKRNKTIKNSNMNDIEKVYWLVEDCKEYGIPAFVGLARVGFVASQLLNSMLESKILTQEQYERFMYSVVTVNKEMGNAFRENSKEEFLRKYGFLRPGTYEITSERYDESPEAYFDWKDKSSYTPKGTFEKEAFINNANMEKTLHALGITLSSKEFLAFIKKSIEGRELSKFLFSKNISDALEIIANIGEKKGISKEDCAYADIKVIRKSYTSTDDFYDLFINSIKNGKIKYNLEKCIKLPSLITCKEDLYFFEKEEIAPNFITNGKIKGKTILLNQSKEDSELMGKILLIPYADPGYDWIFTHQIGGLITKFGGINSHIAIRAHELGIPSALGVGEYLFDQYCKSSIIEIDAANEQIKIIS